MDPLFSIIVPVYNTALYLEKCVTSLLSQTLRDIEVILVDDGSTDGSGTLCDELAVGDDRVRVIHKTNAGQGLARNDGLDLARGEFVLFVDSDDAIEADSCEQLLRFIREHDLQLCSYGYVIEDRDGNEVTRPTLRTRVYEGDAVRTDFVPHYFGDSPEDPELRGVSSCMTAFRRDLILAQGARFPSEREVLSEDTVFSLEVCRGVTRAGVLAEYLYHYYQNPVSFSHAYRPDRFEKMLRFRELLRGYADLYGIADAVEVRMDMLLWVILMESVRQELRREEAPADAGKERLACTESADGNRTEQSADAGSAAGAGKSGTAHAQQPSHAAKTRRRTLRREIRANIRVYCGHEETQAAVRRLRRHPLGVKQKALLLAVQYRQYWAVELLARLRNRQGL